MRLACDMVVRTCLVLKARTASKGKTITKSKHDIPASLIDAVCQRLARNQRVRRTLPAKGRLHIDRQLPFLCVYRQPPDYEDAGTERLVKGEASYLIAPGGAKFRESVSNLVREVVENALGRIRRVSDRRDLGCTRWRKGQRSGRSHGVADVYDSRAAGSRDDVARSKRWRDG